MKSPADRLLGALLVAAALVSLAGCAGTGHGSAQAKGPLEEEELSSGYAILYELVNEEQETKKIFWVKPGTPELKALITAISDYSVQVAADLKQFSIQDSSIEIKQTNLPVVEVKARDLITKMKSKQLTSSNEQQLPPRLIQTELEALNYAWHLSEALAQSDPNPTRSAYMAKSAQKWASLYDKADQMLIKK